MSIPKKEPAVDARRRRLLKVVTLAGAGSAVFGRALTTLAGEKRSVTKEMIRQAEWVAGVEYTDDERELMLGGIEELQEAFETIRATELDNAVSPALLFRPLDATTDAGATPVEPALPAELAPGARPATDEDLAFAPVTELAALLRSRRISSVELTRIYLERLKRYDPELECVIGYTEETALAEAERADQEIGSGRWRGPLHGVPWGAKDLLAVPGYPTTWGAEPFRDQRRPGRATVAARLEQAGSVLLAKLSLGALAWGDVWFGGTTKNPWNTEQGSSGSSAGSSAATAAGLVGFAIGSETWGSIVSPCTRCGATGLRPTFGRVSRHGAMALSWSMDKLGPIARSVEDCALIFSAIQGPDGLDPTVVRRPFSWPLGRDVRTLRLGYIAEQFERDRTEGVEEEEQRAGLSEWAANDRNTLAELERIGLTPVPIELPAEVPVGALAFILTAEAAAAFDGLTRSGSDDELVRQIERAWPNVFRQGQLIPAVEYIRANRIRRLLMEQFERVMDEVDLFVSPSFGGDTLLMTNLTGHPQVVLPNGFRKGDGTPTSITFTGRLHGESELLAVAREYQQATGHHLRRPPVGSTRSEG